MTLHTTINLDNDAFKQQNFNIDLVLKLLCTFLHCRTLPYQNQSLVGNLGRLLRPLLLSPWNCQTDKKLWFRSSLVVACGVQVVGTGISVCGRGSPMSAKLYWVLMSTIAGLASTPKLLTLTGCFGAHRCGVCIFLCTP